MYVPTKPWDILPKNMNCDILPKRYWTIILNMYTYVPNDNLKMAHLIYFEQRLKMYN